MLVCYWRYVNKKIILGIMVFGLVGLICGSARGQTAENIIKLKIGTLAGITVTHEVGLIWQ